MSGAGSGGSVLQLVTLGHFAYFQNHNASATLWRYQNINHTNFAAEPVTQSFDNTPLWNNTVANCTIARTGDLIHRQYIVITLPPIYSVYTAGSTTSYPAELGDSMGAHSAVQALPGATDAYRYYTPYDELWTGLAGVIEGHYCYWVDAIGFAMLKRVELNIGGNVVDYVTAESLFCWDELSGQVGKRAWDMIGRFETREQRILFARNGGILHVPLPFWYTQITGNALSLITLAFNAVKLHVTFDSLVNLVIVSNTDISPYKATAALGFSGGTALAASDLTASVMSEMIYLDVMERNSFLQGEFDNLISCTQVSQFTVSSGSTADLTLSFNFPVMELIVACRLTANRLQNQVFNFGRNVPSVNTASSAPFGVGGQVSTSYLSAAQRASLGKPAIPIQTEGTWQYTGNNSVDRFAYNTNHNTDSTGQWSLANKVIVNADPITDMSLYINNNLRMNTQSAAFHRQVHPRQHHSRIPTQYIYNMSFAMFPEEPNSSGSLNFSRLDNARLRISIHSDVQGAEMVVFVIARSWNLFSYTRGVGGTKFVS